MKRFLIVLFIFISLKAKSQIHDAWVYFNNKPQASYFLANPLEMLSQKALDRRNNQNISLNFTDVPIEESYISQIENIGNIQIKAKSKWLNSIHVQGTQQDIESLLNLNFVQEIEFADKTLNNPGRPSIGISTQEIVPNQTSVLNYGSATNQIQIHNGHQLHQEGFTGQGKTIAVIDNGFLGVDSSSSFQYLHDNNLILGGYDFVSKSDNFYTSGNHGTRVLSTIAANSSGQIIGTAPNAYFYLFISEDNTQESPLEESYWVEAAERADSLGVDIINTSLGYSSFDNPNYNYTYQNMDGQTAYITRGLNHAHSKGIICVTSAGNSGGSAWQYITAPADSANSLTVGAVNNVGQYANFSSTGPTSDNRIKPNVVAQGVSAVTINETGNLSGVNGTSFSAPIIAGLTACLWQAHPELNNQEIIDLIQQASHLYNNPNNQLGHGIPDFYQAYLNGNLSISQTTNNQIKVFPNPVKDILNFSNLNNSSKKFQLFDTIGKKIFETEITNESHLILEQLNGGIYLYKIIDNHSEINGKIIKK